MAGRAERRAVVGEAIRACVPGLLVAVGVSFFVSLSVLIIPFFMLQIFSRVLTSGSMATLTALTVIAAVGLALFGVFSFLRSVIYFRLGEWLHRRLSLESLPAMVRGALKGSGSAGQVLRDVADLRSFLTGGTLSVALELLWSPIFFVFLFWMHWAYGLTAIVSGLIMTVFAVVNELATHKPLEDVAEANLDSYSKFGNALRNAEAIEAMGMMGVIARRWLALNEQGVDKTRVAFTRGEVISALSKSARLMMQIAIMVVGVVVVLAEEASPASLFAAMIVIGRALGPYEQLVDGWRRWVHAFASLKRVRKAFEAGEDDRATMPLPILEGQVTVDRLVFVPPGSNRAVLKGISFTIQPGEAIAIVGPSAAGKSTLARLLVGIWRPTAGAVRIDGHDVYTWERESFGRHVGYLPQAVGLFEATIKDNITRLDPDPDPADVVRAAKAAGIHEMIGRFPLGYDTDIGDNGYLLSGGQRQRLALARALYGDPRFVVMDEPDANLDSEGEASLVEAVTAMGARGAVVVLVTHRPSVLRCVDRVVVMRDGMVERIVPRDQFMKAGGGTPEAAAAQAALPAAAHPRAEAAGGE